MKDNNKHILLAHGSGGKLTHELIKDIFARYFDNEYLSPLSDSALIELSCSGLSFTTDSYVIKPLFFPGGDIGKLAICGTVNDLVVTGAAPKFLSCGFVIEEGFSFEMLEKIVSSMAATAKMAGVKIVTGDTKVVEKDAADGLFINTAGIGERSKKIILGYDEIKPGDKILVNGTLGDHGIAVMAAREGLGLSSNIKSDCALLSDLTDEIFNHNSKAHGSTQDKNQKPQMIKFMRDPTRGGLATTLCEIAEQTGYEIEIKEAEIPISKEVAAVSEILGINPLYSANEGKVIIIASAESADGILDKMKNHHLGKESAMIGEIKNVRSGRVNLKTEIGTIRQLAMLTGNQLPRIC